MLSVCVMACSEPDEAAERILPGGPPVCPGGAPVPTVRIVPELATIGLNPNVVRPLGDGTFAIAESASNTVSRWNGEALEQLVDVGGSRNPYDVASTGDEAWVTNYLSQTVTVVDLGSGESVELEHPSLEDPSGVDRYRDTVVVSNVAFNAPTQPYGQGSFTVWDIATRAVVATHSAAAKNPIFVRAFDDGDDSYLVASSSGELFLSDDGAGVNSPGAVEIWSGDARAPNRRVFDVPQVDDPQIGAPGRPLLAPNGDLYFASGTAPVLFRLNPDSGWVHGADDPLRFAESSGDALHHAAMSDRGVILITSFNDDALYLWDTSCDQIMHDRPIDLGVTSLLEGPHGVAISSESGTTTEALFIMNLSNVLGRVVLEWD
jgi:hypothetical protein